MAYTRTIKHYNAAGSYQATITDCYNMEFNLGFNRGCLGGQFSVSGEVGDAFAYDVGEIIKCYYDVADGTPYYMGFISKRGRGLTAHQHDYELEGLFTHGIDGLTIATAETWTTQTIDTIVTSLFNDYIGGEITHVVDSAAYIVGTQALASFSVKVGDSLTKILDTLVYLAAAAGSIHAYGIDAAGNFYFGPVSTDSGDLQCTVTAATDAMQADETDDQGDLNNLLVVGEESLTNGLLAKKTFTYGSNSLTKRLTAHVMGIVTSGDMSLFADGWFAKYGTASTQVGQLAKVDAGDKPIPWSGTATYNDSSDTEVATDFIKRISVDFNATFDAVVELGLSGDGNDPFDAASDPYSPAALENCFREPRHEYLDPLPEATDETTPDTTQPRKWSSDALDTKIGAETEDLLVDTPGLAGARGNLLYFWHTGGSLTYDATPAATQEKIYCSARVATGGTALEAGAVKFYYRYVDDSDVVQTTAFVSGVKDSGKSTDDYEFWADETGISIAGTGYIQLAVCVIKETNPSLVQYYYPGTESSVDWDIAPRNYIIDLPLAASSSTNWSFLNEGS